MTPALKAHLRLLASTPSDRIHTHHRKPALERKQGLHVGGAIPRELIEDVWKELKAGRRKNEILAELRMGHQLFDKIHAMLLERLDAKARQEEIERLSNSGVPERRIAFAVGVSRTTVQNHLRAARRRFASPIDDEVQI